jgi:carboxymethylenebutenolidase
MNRWKTFRQLLGLALCVAPFVSGIGDLYAAQFDYGPQPFGPYETEERWGTFDSDAADGTVRYFLVKPKGDQAYPGVYYIYGRPGLDHRLYPELRRLASHGFTVFVTHFQEALLIPILLPASDPPETVQVQNDGFDELLRLKERSPGKVCVIATVRGGFYGMRLASRPEAACYIGYHPVGVDHSWPEQYQDVTILPAIRDVKVPTMLMIGGGDYEVRQNQSKRAAQYLEMHGVPVDLVVYPDGKRGFDFRTRKRSLADDMGKIDSMNRTVTFLRKNLGVPGYENTVLKTNAAAPLPTTIRLPNAEGGS